MTSSVDASRQPLPELHDGRAQGAGGGAHHPLDPGQHVGVLALGRGHCSLVQHVDGRVLLRLLLAVRQPRNEPASALPPFRTDDKHIIIMHSDCICQFEQASGYNHAFAMLIMSICLYRRPLLLQWHEKTNLKTAQANACDPSARDTATTAVNPLPQKQTSAPS